MALATITINQKGLQKVIADLSDVKTKSMNTSAIMKNAGVLMLKSIENNFRTGGRPRKWEMLAWSTALRKLKERRSILPLTYSGDLRRSITFRISGNGKKLSVGTSIPYAAIHQFGGTIDRKERTTRLLFKKSGGFMSLKSARRRKKGSIKFKFASIGSHSVHIPARPFLLFQDEDIDHINSLIAEHMLKSFSKRGNL